jgi:polyisoprenoid-binding protein YceI
MRLATSILAAAALLAAAPAALSQGRAAPSTDPAQVAAGTYTLDKRHTSVIAKVSHFGFSNYAMRFDSIEGSLDFNPKTPTASKLTIRIDPRSISTGLPDFDIEIEDKFFNAGKHPQITYVSQGVSAVAGNKGRLLGDLTFNGVTKPVTLDVTFNGAATNMRGTPTMGFSATGVFKRSDFNVAGQLPTNVVGDEVTLLIEAEFNKA